MMEARELTAFVTDKAIALIKALHNPPIGAKEFSGGWCPERCDAVLFCSSHSYMIETKISRSDFLADFKKKHRNDGPAVGNYRYYACPVGLIKPEEVPFKWGLIYVNAENKKARATMPVGYGGWLDKSGQKHLWTYQREKEYAGTPVPEEIKDLEDWWKHPKHPSRHFRFADTSLERNYLFALATRYKQQKFMENIL